MPFKLKIDEVKLINSRVKVKGRIIEGAYFGPEAIKLHLGDGSVCKGYIYRHLLDYPEGWPVIPEHSKTLVTLEIEVYKVIDIDSIGNIVTGEGVLLHNDKRIDISKELSNPLFWCCHFMILTDEEDRDESIYESIFGIDQDRINNYYNSLFDSNYSSGIWPFVKIKIDNERYIEIEYSAGIEYQTRYWIGKKDSYRVLVGYESGHFSLPGIRLEELKQIINFSQEKSEIYRYCVLMPSCYLEAEENFDVIIDAINRLPGLLNNKSVEVSKNSSDYQRNKDLIWKNTTDKGWINNGLYSQRNPESKMSLLTEEDFKNIAEFFMMFDKSYKKS